MAVANQERPTSLRVAQLQMALEPTLAANRDKIVHFVGEAARQGCQLFITPESALMSPPGTPSGEVAAAVGAIAEATKQAGIHAIVCLYEWPPGRSDPVNHLLVIEPSGEVAFRYVKWFNEQPRGPLSVVQVAGVACGLIICADRWLRGVEDLPARAGARLLIECSDNHANEWVSELGWFWYQPRAQRNGAPVLFTNTAPHPDPSAPHPLRDKHGHTAAIGADGTVLAALDAEVDRLLISDLRLPPETSQDVLARWRHPALSAFWDAGVDLIAGETVASVELQPRRSSPIQITTAVAQIACSRDMHRNVIAVAEAMAQAGKQAVDLLVFPELALTGPHPEDIVRPSQDEIQDALIKIASMAPRHNLTLIVGTPLVGEEGARYNVAVVIGPDGQVQAICGQLAVLHGELFQPWPNPGSRWFQVNGAWVAISIGKREALWNEFAELSAVAGAQVQVHLDNSSEGSLSGDVWEGPKRAQVWANLATFRTLTVCANAADPSDLGEPSLPADGGSMIWQDFRRARGQGPYGYCPVPVATAGRGVSLVVATETVEAHNPHLGWLRPKMPAGMDAWYRLGVAQLTTRSKA